ncbi:hypothetical protein GCM10009678_35960 [Actinomadura kijaniata]
MVALARHGRSPEWLPGQWSQLLTRANDPPPSLDRELGQANLMHFGAVSGGDTPHTPPLDLPHADLRT